MRPLFLVLPGISGTHFQLGAENLFNYIKSNTQVDLESVLQHIALSRAKFAHWQVGLLNHQPSAEDLLWQVLEQPEDVVRVSPNLTAKPNKTAFLFTGGGAQYHQMGQQMYAKEKVFADAVDEVAALGMHHLAIDIREVMFAAKEDEHAYLLNRLDYMQLGLFAYQYGMVRLWESWGVRADVYMGHSLGELTAACMAGVCSLADGVKITCLSGHIVQKLPALGRMMVVQAGAEVVSGLVADYAETVALAVENSPKQTVLSGKTEDIEALQQQLEAQGIETKVLVVSHAFHSPLMAPAVEEYRAMIESLDLQPAKYPFISNIMGGLADGRVSTVEHWMDHLLGRVKFDQGSQALRDLGVDTLIEVGPNPVLLGILQESGTLPSDLRWLSSGSKSQPDAVYESLARYWVEGGDIHVSALYPDADSHSEYPSLEALLGDALKHTGDGEAMEMPTYTAEELERLISQALKPLLGLAADDSVSVDRPLRELGLNSLQGITLTKQLGQKLRRPLSVSLLFSYPTVASLAQYLAHPPAMETPKGSPKQDTTSVEEYSQKLDGLSSEELATELDSLLEGISL